MSVSISLIEPSSYKTLPWKNGKGTTKEIAIYPLKSTVQDGNFLWRLSSASVSENGPFSEYPGFDRYLSIIKGEAIQLNYSDGKKIQLSSGAFVKFPGEEKIECCLPNGAIEDLNLIIKRHAVDAQFDTIKGDETKKVQISGDFNLIFCVGNASQAHLEIAEKKYVLKDQHTILVRLDPAEKLAIKTAQFSGSLILIQVKILDCKNSY